MHYKDESDEVTLTKAHFAKVAMLILIYSSDGRVVRASASDSVDSSLISSRVKPMTIKLVFTASLIDTQHYRDSVENKPASLAVVPLGKALNGVTPSWCGRQGVGNS